MEKNNTTRQVSVECTFIRLEKPTKVQVVLVTTHYRISMKVSGVVKLRYQYTVILVMAGCSYFFIFRF